MKCKCIDSLHVTKHKSGCKTSAKYGVVLRRVQTTYQKPIPMCAACAKFAELFCDGFAVSLGVSNISLTTNT